MGSDVLKDLYAVVSRRREEPMEGSYTNYLFGQGLNKILKKCGEECSEVLIAAKDGEDDPLKGEICDLLYHLIVLMVERDIPLQDIYSILEERSKKIGNRKPSHQVDHCS